MNVPSARAQSSTSQGEGRLTNTATLPDWLPRISWRRKAASQLERGLQPTSFCRAPRHESLRLANKLTLQRHFQEKEARIAWLNVWTQIQICSKLISDRGLDDREAFWGMLPAL
jgi:hypothetical protein